jgi:hypothetical protein
MCANFLKVSLNFLLPVKIDTVAAHSWMISEAFQYVVKRIQKRHRIVPEA